MISRRTIALLAAALIPLAQAGAACAAAPPLAVLAWDRPETQTTGPALQVNSANFHPGGPIPQTYAASGKNISPQLSWSAPPSSAKSLVLIVQDPDSDDPRPALHWLAYNIPATVKALPRGVRNTSEPTSPLGMLQGWNFHGSVGYTGPRPPVGDPPHHYHFQLFAVDRVLRVRPGAQPLQVIRVMSGHVVARGELVGLYAEAAPKPDPTQADPSPPAPPAQP